MEGGEKFLRDEPAEARGSHEWGRTESLGSRAD
jgi:hypothetical protein